MVQVYLAGDIGGTKTHLALFASGERRKWLVDHKFPSKDYPNLIDIVKVFLGEHSDYSVERAAFGIAGPVEGKICKATNLPWVIDASVIEKECGIASVSLLNDLEANAYGIEVLEDDELFVLNEGKKKEGNRALISAGTGLGEAGIYWDGKAYHPFACEGGHSSFAPESPIEVELLQYLHQEFGHVSFERTLSGPGLFNIYKFLIDSGHEEAAHEVKKAKDVTIHGVDGTEQSCVRALELFCQIYGNKAASLALTIFALGGLYIGGGIAPKILPFLKEGGFLKQFTNKGRFSTLLSEIPVRVILNEFTALLGAAYYAREKA